MKKENHPIYWFVINLALLVGSMFMTWFMIVIIDSAFAASGWNFIFWKLFSAIEEFQKHNFQLIWFLALLEGIGGVFIIGYILFIIVKIARRKIFAGSKTRSIILMVTVIFLLFSNLAPRVHLGYWLFMAGSLSSAILEWYYSRLPIDLQTGKRTRRR